MAEEFQRTAQFHGASFRESDLFGLTVRDSDLREARIASSWVDGMRITGFDGAAGSLFVDDVEVSEFVADELDRRHPERVQLRAARTADDLRAMWPILKRLWAQTKDRAETLPESVRNERVDGEWSFVETLRHLIFGIDSWVGVMLTDPPEPYHRLGLPPTDFSDEDSATLGLDRSARPGYTEVVEALDAQWARVDAVLAELTDADLEQLRTGSLGVGEEPETVTVAHCLGVILREHTEHRRFAERDLAALASAAEETSAH
ncbi:DinB family protein [Occultella aeris]|uniref:DinB superfamily protein n=1 Tax=Occultella aeris TaxID=2761496 RepID=A0A7M4DM90_9MICO|nr:DinB family protein [Occultella aeris]VZO38489.1 DinB superfamily protein [Occultella aeris]